MLTKKRFVRKNTRAKNKFLFIIFFYFFFYDSTPKKMCINFGITVIFLKKIFFFRGKRFTFFITVIFFFHEKKVHESFPEEKKMTVTKNVNLFPLKIFFFKKKMTVTKKMFMNLFLKKKKNDSYKKHESFSPEKK